ncbi:MAG TPA: 4'-phosphopantetheinyl transferase superfamily protein [Casimicrobiaceae bacterium]|jgi:KDO2-lipid IV(A) lauroyltransferase|nr:4'-phosphopantetheinyl transferase superfamily protein [Casimicrobiaceae bacterium]
MAEAPAAIPDAATRCGIDTVEIARIERLLSETTREDLHRFFSAQELDDSGEGAGRAASLAARFAAKEACVKLFPREAALGEIEPGDFSVARDAYGAPRAILSPRAAAVLAKNRIKAIALSLTHDRLSASSVALALAEATQPPLSGRLIFRLLPFRRGVVLDNLRRVFGAGVPDAEIERLAQAHYAHLWRLFTEFLRFRSMSERQKAARVEVENVAVFTRALERGKGILVLTGHFGNWEVATVAGLSKFPQMRGRIHFVRRPIKPRWLDRFVNWRFRRAGFGVLPKRGSLDAILDRLAAGDVIVFPFDQHAGPPDGIEIDFFGTPVWTFKSLALIALASDAAVVPAASWREPDGRHVLRFEEPLPPISCAEVGEEIRRNTRSYNAALERLILRHPEQWYWVHRRWKRSAPRARARRA